MAYDFRYVFSSNHSLELNVDDAFLVIVLSAVN